MVEIDYSVGFIPINDNAVVYLIHTICVDKSVDGVSHQCICLHSVAGRCTQGEHKVDLFYVGIYRKTENGGEKSVLVHLSCINSK